MIDKFKAQILKLCLFGLCAHSWLGQPKHLDLDGHHTSIHEGIHKGWRPPKAAASFMDGCVVVIQTENFGLPKPAVGTEGQANKI